MAALSLRGNSTLGQAGPAAFAALPALPELTQLELGACALLSCPAALSSLPSLLDLSLADNPELGSGQAAFPPLAGCRALARLDLSRCCLRAVPREAAALPGLTSLLLHGNTELGEAAAAAAAMAAAGAPAAGEGGSPFAALARCSGLRSLGLGACALPGLPAELALLPALEFLDAEMNEGLGQAGASGLAVLHGCASLTCVVLRACGLRAADVPSLPAASIALS